MDPTDRRQRELCVMRDVINEVVEERVYQRKRWSEERDRGWTPEEWIAILSTYIGKAAMEAPIHQGPAYDKGKFRKRMTQIAALGVACLEALRDNPPQALEETPVEQ